MNTLSVPMPYSEAWSTGPAPGDPSKVIVPTSVANRPFDAA
nr:hypothetical protein [Antrihabitans stalagmiti]